MAHNVESFIVNLVKIVLAPLVVIVLASSVAILLYKLKKPTKPKIPVKAIARVEVRTLEAAKITPVVRTFGNTSSYLETQLSPQVSGEIIELAPTFDVGKLIDAGDWLVKINPADFKTILADRKSALDAAKRTLAEEQTRSRLAREDWRAAGRSFSQAPAFTLRIPQLQAAQTSLESAEAAVQQAELDIERTVLRAPFDAIVASRETSLGEVISAGSILGNLIAREKAEVVLPLTPEQVQLVNLKRIKTNPIQAVLNSAARPELEWTATIRRINPVIDSQNRTVQVIAEIPKPFDQEGKILPIGAFMKATIAGEELTGVYELEESSVVEDSYIWCVGPDKKLKLQPIKLVARQVDNLIVRIEDKVVQGAVRMVRRPLASFSAGQEVKVVSPNKP